MKSALSALYLLVLGLWFGGNALYTFVATPAVFARYGRNQAGEIVGVMMPHYFRWMLLCMLGAAVLLALQWASSAPRVRVFCLAVVAAGLLAQGHVNFNLYPKILAVKARVASFEADPDSPERRAFRSLHGQSMALNLATLLAGAALLAAAPRLRR